VIVDRVLQMDAGGESAYTFARHKAHALIAAGTDIFTHSWQFPGFTITVRCAKDGGDHIVRYMVSGGSVDGTRLYFWDDTTAIPSSTGPWGYRLSSIIDSRNPPPASKVVTPVALNGLGLTLSFNLAGANFVHASITALPGFKSRFIRLLERLVRNDSWLALQVFSLGMQYMGPVVWHGQAVPIFVTDSILGRWSNGDFYLMLGSITGPTTPPGARLVDRSYTGIIVPWSVLKAAFGNAKAEDGSSYTSLDDPDIAVRVRDVGGLSIKAEGLYSSAGSVSRESNTRLPRTSPYALCFDYQISTNAGGTSPNGSGSFDTDETFTFDRTLTAIKLDASGSPVQESMLNGLEVGTTSISNAPPVVTGGTGYAPSGLLADLTFFSGGEFIRYGRHQTSGNLGSSSQFQTMSRDQDVPADFTEFRGYIHEYSMVIAGTGINGTVIAPITLTGQFLNHSFAFLGGGGQTFFNMTGLPDTDYVSTFEHVSVVGASNSSSDTGFQSAMGTGPYTNWRRLALGTPMAQDSGLPPARQAGPGGSLDTPLNPWRIGAVYWPRDGGLGVFIYQFPTDQSAYDARAADVAKYQHIATKAVGYRHIQNKDGTFTDEAGYEDPEVVIARIAQNTTVIVNNFASPALFPWLTEGFSGVILDP
jgi:hypothetical protein